MARQPSSRVYATWNPSDKFASIMLSNGNLTAATTPTPCQVRSTISKSSGKWYWEILEETANYGGYGAASGSASLSTYPGQDANSYGLFDNVSGNIIGVALDMDGLILRLYLNNVLQATYTSIPAPMYASVGSNTQATTLTANFGATAFTYSPPAGHNAGLYI